MQWEQAIQQRREQLNEAIWDLADACVENKHVHNDEEYNIKILEPANKVTTAIDNLIKTIQTRNDLVEMEGEGCQIERSNH